MSAHLVWTPSRRLGTKVAYLRFTLQGQKFQRSLKTDNKITANAVLYKVKETLRRLEHGDIGLPDGLTYDEAYDFIVAGGKLDTPAKLAVGKSLQQVVQEYFDCLPEGSKERSSLATEKIHTGHLERLLGKRTLVRALNAARLQEYVSKRCGEKGRRDKKIQPATIKKELQTFRQLWTFAKSRRYLEGECPTCQVRLPKPDEKPPFQTWSQIEAAAKLAGPNSEKVASLWDSLFLGESEVLDLLAYVKEHAEHPFVYVMFALAAFTGARRSEIIRSQRSDFDFERKVVLIREKKRRTGVGISFRHVDLNPQLDQIMHDWFAIHPGGPYTVVVPPGMAYSRSKSHDLPPLTENQAHDHFKRTLAGSQWKVVRGFHVLRHSFASICAARGIARDVIDRWLGHQTEEMRNRYRHLFPEEGQQAMGRVLAGGPLRLLG